MTYNLCKCDDSLYNSFYSGGWFIEAYSINNKYERTDRTSLAEAIRQFNETSGLQRVSIYDSNTKVPKDEYSVIMEFNNLSEIQEEFPEVFI